MRTPRRRDGLGVFLHHDGVGVRRHRRAGEDARRRRPAAAAGRRAGGNALADRQHHPSRHIGARTA
jgi:hypothetical protein